MFYKMFYKIVVLESFVKFTRTQKTPVLELIFGEVAGIKEIPSQVFSCELFFLITLKIKQRFIVNKLAN